MIFEIEVAGRRRVVEMPHACGGSRVSVDGTIYAVDAARVGDVWSLIVGPAFAAPRLRRGKQAGHYDSQGDTPPNDTSYVVSELPAAPQPQSGEGGTGRSYEVRILERPERELIVHVNGVRFAVTVAGGAAAGSRRSPSRARPADVKQGPQRIVAPMPGRIVKVLAKVGDEVKANQGLVVVEAMKMQNELRAPRAGTVTDIRVVDGALVDANAILMVID